MQVLLVKNWVCLGCLAAPTSEKKKATFEMEMRCVSSACLPASAKDTLCLWPGRGLVQRAHCVSGCMYSGPVLFCLLNGFRLGEAGGPEAQGAREVNI